MAELGDQGLIGRSSAAQAAESKFDVLKFPRRRCVCQRFCQERNGRSVFQLAYSGDGSTAHPSVGGGHCGTNGGARNRVTAVGERFDHPLLRGRRQSWKKGGERLGSPCGLKRSDAGNCYRCQRRITPAKRVENPLLAVILVELQQRREGAAADVGRRLGLKQFRVQGQCGFAFPNSCKMLGKAQGGFRQGLGLGGPGFLVQSGDDVVYRAVTHLTKGEDGGIGNVGVRVACQFGQGLD